MSVLNNKKILNASKLSLILNRLASQLFENHNDFSEVVLIGLQPRGTILSKKLKRLIEKNYSIKNVNLGFLDVTFFRDDFGRGDKVLSAGEISKISGNNIDIINTEIGITSKDLSEVSLTDLKIKDTRL